MPNQIKLKQIKELKKMVDRTISGFKGKDKVTIEVNMHLHRAYNDICSAYNAAHGWISKSKKKATID